MKKIITEIRKEQIAQAALDTISVHGMKGLNIANVARKVGIVPSGIYRHFKSKEKILYAIFDLIKQKLLSNVALACEQTSDPIERLKRILSLHTQLILQNKSILRVFFSDDTYSGYLHRNETKYKIISDYLNKIVEIIQQGQANGQIRKDLDTQMLSVLFLGIIQPAAILGHLSNEQFDLTKHVGKAWEFFSESILAA